MGDKAQNKSALVRFDKPAIAERLAPRLQELADAKGFSFSRMVLQSIREYLDRTEGGPDIVQMHVEQQRQRDAISTGASLLSALSLQVAGLQKSSNDTI